MSNREQVELQLAISEEELLQTFQRYSEHDSEYGLNRRIHRVGNSPAELIWESENFRFTATVLKREEEVTVLLDFAPDERQRVMPLWQEFIAFMQQDNVVRINQPVKGTPLKVTHAFLRFPFGRNMKGWTIIAKETKAMGQMIEFDNSQVTVREPLGWPRHPTIVLVVYEASEGSIIQGEIPGYYYKPWRSLWEELLGFLATEGFIDQKMGSGAPEVDTLEPWQKIPEHGHDRHVVKLWNEGYKAKEIGDRVGIGEGAASNLISQLRRSFPALVMTDDERKRLEIKKS